MVSCRQIESLLPMSLLSTCAGSVCPLTALQTLPGLQINCHMHTLDLSSNAVDIDGISALADALRENESLECLILRWAV